VIEDRLTLRGMVLRVDGSEVYETTVTGSVNDAHDIGVRAGRHILERLPAGVLP
jgi:porphobilinogen deaminase